MPEGPNTYDLNTYDLYLQNVPVDRQRMLRVFCRAKGKVGGISVHDHFEINLAPLTIGITQGRPNSREDLFARVSA